MMKFIKSAIKVWLVCIVVVLALVVIDGVFKFLTKWLWVIVSLCLLGVAIWYFAFLRPKRGRSANYNLQSLVSKGLAEETTTIEDAKSFFKTHVLVRSFHTRVVGVKYPNDDGTSRQEILSRCLRGEPVSFYWYRYDGAPACAVISDHGQIGHLSADLAADLHYDYDDDRYCFVAYISDVTGGKYGEYYGCNLLLEIYEQM